MYRILLFLLVSFLIACSAKRPKNIILLIGDGMGPAQITALKTVAGKPNMERFHIAGFATTFSADKYVTDSAAGATAIATGNKTSNYAISVDNQRHPLKTVLEYAEERNMSTGLVVTCAVTHATPAAFAAHQESRKMMYEIAEDMANSGVDVLIGGGYRYFVPQDKDSNGRSDQKDLLAALGKRVSVVNSDNEFLKSNDTKGLIYLYASDHPGKIADRALSLGETTQKAIDVLSKNTNGFFLMVEGSQIDWGGHANDAGYIISEIKDFDGAIGKALDFAEKDGQTLVVVTADHETGGFALLDGSIKDKQVTETAFVTKEHTAVMVPVFAYGPGGQAFGGIIDNTDIGKLLIKYTLEK